MLILNLYTKIMFQKLFKNICVCVNCVCMYIAYALYVCDTYTLPIIILVLNTSNNMSILQIRKLRPRKLR